MGLEENKTVARVWFDEVINKHNVDALDRFNAEDYIYHNEDGSVTIGRDFARTVATRLIESAPDRVEDWELVRIEFADQ